MNKNLFDNLANQAYLMLKIRDALDVVLVGAIIYGIANGKNQAD